jgi:hypothetical protein
MSQEGITRYGCDNCAREVFSAKPPTGWSKMTFVGQTQTIFDDADICESCSDAFVTTMTRRKQIESGRYVEPELVIHNAPHPSNARYSPFTKRPVEAVENVE